MRVQYFQLLLPERGQRLVFVMAIRETGSWAGRAVDDTGADVPFVFLDGKDVRSGEGPGIRRIPWPRIENGDRDEIKLDGALPVAFGAGASALLNVKRARKNRYLSCWYGGSDDQFLVLHPSRSSRSFYGSIATAINGEGLVVGHVGTSSDIREGCSACIWCPDDDKPTLAVPANPPLFSTYLDVNNRGQAVGIGSGWAREADKSGWRATGHGVRSFLLQSGCEQPVDLDRVNDEPQACSISNAGWIVGCLKIQGRPQAAIWEGQRFSALFQFPGSAEAIRWSKALWICHKTNTVVGTARTNEGLKAWICPPDNPSEVRWLDDLLRVYGSADGWQLQTAHRIAWPWVIGSGMVEGQPAHFRLRLE